MPHPTIRLPVISYQPQDPQKYWPAIGLIGCGAITGDHLRAYRAAEYNVVALCDIDRAAAERRRDEFFPSAQIFTDYRQLLEQEEVVVVDIATHPLVRAEMLEAALLADKHVLSQKPFVLDLDFGQRLVELAAQRKLKLAVNQNGRWAPHFSYMRQAISAGLVGQVEGVHMAVHWDHNWVKGTEFEKIKHLILYDFAIHWFDILTCFMGPREPQRVFATTARSATQTVSSALLAQAVVQYENGQASLVFDGNTKEGWLDTSYVAGSTGSLLSCGRDINNQTVTLSVQGHQMTPRLVGRWFPDGFHGAMGELLQAIEEQREPEHSAANNLRSLALCFAAVASAERGEPVEPRTVRRLPD